MYECGLKLVSYTYVPMPHGQARPDRGAMFGLVLGNIVNHRLPHPQHRVVKDHRAGFFIS